MNMYHCINCGAIFDEPTKHTWKEIHYELDGAPSEDFEECLCPECNSDMIEDAWQCEVCGDYFALEDLDENWICERCRDV